MTKIDNLAWRQAATEAIKIKGTGVTHQSGPTGLIPRLLTFSEVGPHGYELWFQPKEKEPYQLLHTLYGVTISSRLLGTEITGRKEFERAVEAATNAQ